MKHPGRCPLKRKTQLLQVDDRMLHELQPYPIASLPMAPDVEDAQTVKADDVKNDHTGITAQEQSNYKIWKVILYHSKPLKNASFTHKSGERAKPKENPSFNKVDHHLDGKYPHATIPSREPHQFGNNQKQNLSASKEELQHIASTLMHPSLQKSTYAL